MKTDLRGIAGVAALGICLTVSPSHAADGGAPALADDSAESGRHLLLPPARERGAPPLGDAAAAIANRVFVREISISGNVVVSDQEVRALAKSYVNREVSYEELERLRQEITRYYVSRGFINSGAVIPDQELLDGIVRLNIIEGRLTEIKIAGNKHFRSEYFMNKIAAATHPVLDVNRLQDQLTLFQQDDRIRKLDAQLSPGAAPGESTLELSVEERSPWRAAITFGNTQPPSVGEDYGEATLAHANVLGFGDVLEASFGLSEGTRNYGVRYSIPLNSRDTTLQLSARKEGSAVQDEAFASLDIESRTTTYGVNLSHPVVHTPTVQLLLSLGDESERSESFLLGVPFSFSAADDSVTRVDMLRFSQDLVVRFPSDALAVHSVVSTCLQAFGFGGTGGGADSSFTHWLLQAQWVRQFGESGVQSVFRTAAQVSSDTLPSSERFPVGGMSSVRGYRENEYVRDNGATVSAELRMPLLRDEQGNVQLQFLPFLDMGWSWNNGGETAHPASLGCGLRWFPARRVAVEIYRGIPLEKTGPRSGALQDRGVHFLLSWQLL